MELWGHAVGCVGAAQLVNNGGAKPSFRVLVLCRLTCSLLDRIKTCKAPSDSFLPYLFHTNLHTNPNSPASPRPPLRSSQLLITSQTQLSKMPAQETQQPQAQAQQMELPTMENGTTVTTQQPVRLPFLPPSTLITNKKSY